MSKALEPEVADANRSIEESMTADQQREYAASIARARAQYKAGEAIPGDAVFEWLSSWGTENELPPPVRVARQR